MAKEDIRRRKLQEGYLNNAQGNFSLKQSQLSLALQAQGKLQCSICSQEDYYPKIYI